MLASSLLYFTTFLAVALSAPECLQCKEEKCDDNNNCLKGCIPGFAGRKCINECPTHCMNSLCVYDGKHGNFPCSVGCKPGYHGLNCKTPCHSFRNGRCDRFSGTAPDCEGRRYGKNCETSCQPECGGSVCDNKGNCYEAVCIPGRCGSECKGYCPADELCHKDSEECLRPNESKDVLKNSECSSDQKGTTRVGAESDVFKIVDACCSTILAIIASILLFFVFKLYGKLMAPIKLRYKNDEVVIIYGGEDQHPDLRIIQTDDENLSCKKKRRSGNQ